MPLEPLGPRGVRPSAEDQEPGLAGAFVQGAGRPLGSARLALDGASSLGLAGRPLLRRMLSLAGIALGLAGCDLGQNYGDLGKQLLDPEVQGVETPGRRWVEGPHYNLNQVNDQDGKRYVTALNADSELVIVDFEKQTYCRAGKVLRYDEPIIDDRRTDALIPVLIQGDVGEDGQPELWLSFTSFDCHRKAFAVPVLGFPSQSVLKVTRSPGIDLVVRARDRGLLVVNPWTETVRRIAGLVRDNDPQSIPGWTVWVDSGVAVLSDATFTPFKTFGHNVVNITASPSAEQVAYIEASGGGTPGGTLFTLEEGEQEPREVASDVCGLQYLTLGRRTKLAYLSPCTDRQLVLRDLDDDSLQVIDTNVAGLPTVREIAGRTVLTYITTPSREAARGTLWAIDGDAAKVAIAEDTRVGPSVVTNNGVLLTVLDWANTGGRLVEWRGGGVTEVAQGVIEIAPLGRMANDDLTLLGNFDGTTGDLLWLRSDLSTEVLASGVPTRSANDRAFIANSDGDYGDLTLLDKSDGSTETLFSGVARGAFIFTQQFNAVMMLARPETESTSNTLRVQLLRSKREYVLNEAVTEAREVAFPSPGVLYNVVSGDNAGIWFAKAL